MHHGETQNNWIPCCTGVRQPIQAMAKLPAGKRYSLAHIDPWKMTVTKTDTAVTGGDDARIPLTGKPYAAFLLEAAG